MRIKISETHVNSMQKHIAILCQVHTTKLVLLVWTISKSYCVQATRTLDTKVMVQVGGDPDQLALALWFIFLLLRWNLFHCTWRDIAIVSLLFSTSIHQSDVTRENWRHGLFRDKNDCICKMFVCNINDAF